MKQTIILLPCAWILAYAQPIALHNSVNEDKWAVQSSVPLAGIQLGFIQPDSILQDVNVPAVKYSLPSPNGSGVRLGLNAALAVPLPFGSGVRSDDLPILSNAAAIANTKPLEAALAGVNPVGTNLIDSQSVGVAVKNTEPNENVRVDSKVDGNRLSNTKLKGTGVKGIEPGKPIAVKTKVNVGVQGTRATGSNQSVLHVGNSVTGKKKLGD